ncbi:MAG: hypothetical protein ACRERU_03545 [Methylococcales bacterium]
MKILDNKQQEFEILKNYIIRQADGNRTLKILEAGCGRQWPLKIDGVQYELTGIDLDTNALEIRKTQAGDLNRCALCANVLRLRDGRGWRAPLVGSTTATNAAAERIPAMPNGCDGNAGNKNAESAPDSNGLLRDALDPACAYRPRDTESRPCRNAGKVPVGRSRALLRSARDVAQGYQFLARNEDKHGDPEEPRLQPLRITESVRTL